MATIACPSSHHHHHNDNDDDNIPTAIPSISAAASSSSRRLPPPCWSPEETVALIDAYKNKWYSLRRGNLRANHWQEVADDIATRSPANPRKTAVQCRHKMEKLRKRYRAEVQRAAAHGDVRRYRSSWVHFQKMHAMEKGPNPTPPSSDDDESDADEEIDHKNSIKRINDLYNRNQKFNFESNPASGVRIKFPGQSTAPPPYPKFDQIGGQYSFPIPKPNHNPNPKFPNPIGTANGAVLNKPKKEGFCSGGEILKNGNADEVVAAIQAMGEGFMRVEKAKMDMVRQIEEMRMEMELKRTEMILDSQHWIVEAFAKAMSERSSKRARKDSTNSGC